MAVTHRLSSFYLSLKPSILSNHLLFTRLRLTSLLLLNLSLSRQPSCPRPPLVFRHHQTSPLIVMMDRPVAIATTSSFYSSSTMLNKNTLEGFPIPPHPPVGQESPQTAPPLLTVLIEQGEVPSDTIDARGGKSKGKRPLAGIISCPVSTATAITLDHFIQAHPFPLIKVKFVKIIIWRKNWFCGEPMKQIF